MQLFRQKKRTFLQREKEYLIMLKELKSLQMNVCHFFIMEVIKAGLQLIILGKALKICLL